MIEPGAAQSGRVPVESLSAHPRNVREGDVGAISVSLGEFGQYRPIVVQRQTPDGEPRMVIVAGTHTWRAAQALGWPEIDAVLLDVSDDTATRIMLADNRTHDLGQDRPEDLARLLEEMATLGALAGTGWDGDDVDRLLFETGILAGRAGEGLTDLIESTATAVVNETDVVIGGEHFVRLAFTVTHADRDTIIAGLRAAAARLGTETQAATLVAIMSKEDGG